MIWGMSGFHGSEQNPEKFAGIYQKPLGVQGILVFSDVNCIFSTREHRKRSGRPLRFPPLPLDLARGHTRPAESLLFPRKNNDLGHVWFPWK